MSLNNARKTIESYELFVFDRLARNHTHMAAIFQLCSSITIALAAASNITVNTGLDRKKCYVQTLEWIRNGNLAEDDEVSFRDSTGQVMNHPNNLIVTLPGCKKLCGAKQNWYFDIGPRLAIWLFPVS